MTPRTTRLIRSGLLVVMAALAAIVVWSLRQARTAAPAAAASPSVEESPTAATRMEEFQHFTFDQGNVKLSIKARSFSGRKEDEMHLQGADVTFGYTTKGEAGTGNITADRCVYTQALQKAVFNGNVHMKTDDGMEMWTESLIHRGDKNLARSEEHVRFQRKDMSGTSTGMIYDAEQRKLELLKDVVVQIRDPDDPPMDIKSVRAVLEREQGLMRFMDDVVVTQGEDRLTTRKLLVNLTEGTEAINRVQAIDDVDLWMGSGNFMGGAAPKSAGRGPRHLRARKLDMWFRPDRTLQEATAGPNADLTLLPATGDAQEKRRLRARFLAFAFDEQGRLLEVRGQKDSSFEAQPIPPATGEPRTLTCQSFVARMDAVSGEPDVIDFNKDVVFVQGSKRATSQKAYYEGAKATLALQDGPSVSDSAEGTTLTAKFIEVGTRSGDLAAHDGVRHLMEKASGEGGLLGGKGEPTLVSSALFDYTESTKTANYRRSAVMRAGKDEIRADEIRIQEQEGGKRRLEAKGNVVSRMQPKPGGAAAVPEAASAGASPAVSGGKPAPPAAAAAPKAGGASPAAAAASGRAPAVLEGRSEEMTYEEAKGEIVYTGDVTIKQGDIQTKSPKATLHLTPGGGDVATLVAGEPVEVQQGARRATGTRATYTPGNETMVLVGDKVVLKDPGQEIEGRSLTFHVGDARILVDGREQVRTQLIIRKEPGKDAGQETRKQ